MLGPQTKHRPRSTPPKRSLLLCCTFFYLLGAVQQVSLADAKRTAAEKDARRGRLRQSAQAKQPLIQHPADANPKPWVETVSWSPRVQVYHNFMTAEECDHLVNISRPLMRRSTVVGEGGKSVLDTIRTSRGTFLRRYRDPVVTRVEQRLELYTHINISHQEDVQILRYSDGEKYGAHMDVLQEETPRMATVLLYLTDTEEGGETAFPAGSTWSDPVSPQRFGPFSECAQGSVAVRPRKGASSLLVPTAHVDLHHSLTDASVLLLARSKACGVPDQRTLLTCSTATLCSHSSLASLPFKGQALVFYSLFPDSKTQDQHSMHTGCPVLQGIKWTGTVWIHTAPFRPESLSRESMQAEDAATYLPEDCQDQDKSCGRWASAGECQKNPTYMVGDQNVIGACRLACGACEVCKPGDAACRNRNRVNAGFPSLDDLT